MEKISLRINDLMHKKNANYRSLGKLLGYSDTAIANIIKGKSKPNFEFVEVLIEKIPNLNPEWLLTGKGEMLRPVEGKGAVSQTLREPGAVYGKVVAVKCAACEEREKVIQGLEARLTDKDKQIEALERVISEKEERIKMKDEIIDLYKKQIEEINSKLAAKNIKKSA